MKVWGKDSLSIIGFTFPRASRECNLSSVSFPVKEATWLAYSDFRNSLSDSTLIKAKHDPTAIKNPIIYMSKDAKEKEK